MKFGIGYPHNVANINVSSVCTIDKMSTGAALVNKLMNYLKSLFIDDVKILGCVYTLIYGSFVVILPIFVVILPIFPHLKQRLSFVERRILVLCSRGW
jgi:hypothetical protein